LASSLTPSRARSRRATVARRRTGTRQAHGPLPRTANLVPRNDDGAAEGRAVSRPLTPGGASSERPLLRAPPRGGGRRRRRLGRRDVDRLELRAAVELDLRAALEQRLQVARRAHRAAVD